MTARTGIQACGSRASEVFSDGKNLLLKIILLLKKYIRYFRNEIRYTPKNQFPFGGPRLPSGFQRPPRGFFLLTSRQVKKGRSMAWVESHEDLGQHPKTLALVTALNGDLPTAVGVLHLLWHFTLKFAWRDGDLSKFTGAAIAQSVGWTKDPSLLMRGLRESGWVDGSIVHDWMVYAGKIVRDRIYNEKRRITASNGDSLRKTAATNLTNLTNQRRRITALGTKPAFQIPKPEEVTSYAAGIGFAIDGSRFCDYYEARGWKIGKTPMKSWKAAVRLWKQNRNNSEEPAKQEIVV